MPEPLPIPQALLPPGVRPMRADDEPAIRAAMLEAHARGEISGVSRQQLEESTERLAATPWLGAVAEDEGRVAGWVVPRHDDLVVDLAFRRRGHGRRLVEAGRILAGHLGYPELRLWVPPFPVPEAFARAVGLRYHSSLWLMRLAEDVVPVPPRFPDDVVVRWLEPGTDEPAFVELVNEIFLDHPSPLSLELDEVRRVHARPAFDPSTILLVALTADRERLVAFCRVGTFLEDDGAVAGEVKLVGVRREARGTGLGRELVRWGIGALRERDAARTFLSVESENEGALRVYEREGFRREVEWPHWAAPVIAPGTAALGMAGPGNGGR
jgi:mycothiol synthase